MVSPSFLNGSKTIRHDDMHLWLCEPENQILAVKTATPKITQGKDIKIICKEQEAPIYSKSYSKYLQGVCDAIITYETRHPVALKLHDDDDDFYWKRRKVIIDFKPVLGSVSGIIGQMKVYRDSLAGGHDTSLLIITYDKVNKYDRLFDEEGIAVLRIES
jgi:hypothetical protein